MVVPAVASGRRCWLRVGRQPRFRPYPFPHVMKPAARSDARRAERNYRFLELRVGTRFITWRNRRFLRRGSRVSSRGETAKTLTAKASGGVRRRCADLQPRNRRHPSQNVIPPSYGRASWKSNSEPASPASGVERPSPVAATRVANPAIAPNRTVSALMKPAVATFIGPITRFHRRHKRRIRCGRQGPSTTATTPQVTTSMVEPRPSSMRCAAMAIPTCRAGI